MIRNIDKSCPTLSTIFQLFHDLSAKSSGIRFIIFITVDEAYRELNNSRKYFVGPNEVLQLFLFGLSTFNIRKLREIIVIFYIFLDEK